jgi:membrane-bound lytic murein transglycosylase D
MIKSNTIKYASIMALSGLVSSCAHITPLESNAGSRKVSAVTASEMINQFKEENQKLELDAIVSENTTEAPAFLEDVKNPTVETWINYFTGRGKERFERYLINGEKYRPIIESVMDDYGLPKELYFVGLIESGYYLKAKSHANAVGPWQFIRSTGLRYGMIIQNGVDERQNIVKATNAAALFFQDLYNIFGSWELALSAYNAGEYGIIRRITAAKTRDFYELSKQKKLPTETMNYVPKVLAAMHVYNNAQKYGIHIPVYKKNIYANLDELKIYKQTSLKQVAQKLSVDEKVLRGLNPDLYQAHIPMRKSGFTLIVPKSESIKLAQEEFKDTPMNLTLPSQARSVASVSRPEFFNYKVKKGDNLSSIARQNHTNISKILKINNLKKRTIFVGQVLKLPQIDMDTYTVKRGDHLTKIAKKHSISVEVLKKLNGIQKNQIYPGQRLIVSINN